MTAFSWKTFAITKDFGGLPDVGPVLDKMSEDLRLRRKPAVRRAPTEGGTKAIDPTSDQPQNIK